MKNLFKFVCILTLSVSGFVFAQDLNALKKDQIFIDYLRKESNVINKVSPEDVDKIKIIVEDKEISENEKEDLAKYLKFENFEAYSTFVNGQNIALRKLQTDYNLSALDPNILTEIIASPEIYPIIDPSTQTFGGECSKSCVRTGNNCRTKTFALGVLSHVGCATMDGVVVGILCHVAVQAALIAEMDECNNQEGVCQRGCK